MNAETLFWLLAGCAVYAYVGYPLWVWMLVKLKRPAVRHRGKAPGSFTVVVAAYNEEESIGRRVSELCGLIADCGTPGELIVVCDGCTDNTSAAARQAASGNVRVIDMPANVGKAVALNTGVAAAAGEVIIFADTRQRWAADAMRRLLDNFADPAVGGVSGDLVLESGPGVMTGVGLYWRYEKWLRKQESKLHSMAGVTGAISAVRRELFRPIPPRTILDDVYWPLRVVMQGFRVVHDESAMAFDQLPHRPRDEFRRKVRTLSANYQLLTRLPGAVLPWRNPIALQFISHKLLRLVVPWAMLGMLIISARLPGTFYHAVFWAQVAFLLVGLVGVFSHLGGKLASAAASFLVLNSAAWLGFWVWALGQAGNSWKKVTYKTQL